MDRIPSFVDFDLCFGSGKKVDPKLVRYKQQIRKHIGTLRSGASLFASSFAHSRSSSSPFHWQISSNSPASRLREMTGFLRVMEACPITRIAELSQSRNQGI
jgi:hypothetical protein